MKRAVILIVLLSVAGSFVFAQMTGRRANRNRIEEEIRRLNNETQEAVLQSDVATLERLWSDDFVVTNPFNQIVNKRQALEMIRSGRIRHTSYERQIEYLHVHGDTAVVMGRETVVDTEPIINRRYTEVWIRRNGRWQTIARHANVIVQQ